MRTTITIPRVNISTASFSPKKSPYGDRQITIKDTIKRLRRGDGHVPRLAYYNDNKLKVLKFKDNVGLTLPNDNYSLEHEN